LFGRKAFPVEKKQRIQDVQTALVDTLPVLAGYIFLGIGFGILLYSKEISRSP